jgi:hypothetical protein
VNVKTWLLFLTGSETEGWKHPPSCILDGEGKGKAGELAGTRQGIATDVSTVVAMCNVHSL